jgi:hypothetical protein
MQNDTQDSILFQNVSQDNSITYDSQQNSITMTLHQAEFRSAECRGAKYNVFE